MRTRSKRSEETPEKSSHKSPSKEKTPSNKSQREAVADAVTTSKKSKRSNGNVDSHGVTSEVQLLNVVGDNRSESNNDTTKSTRKRNRKSIAKDMEDVNHEDENSDMQTSSDVSSLSSLHAHRCRFIDWEPQAIMAMAANTDGSAVAVSRKGASLQVWEVRGTKWHQVVQIPGQESPVGEIIAIRWVGQDRLFAGDLEGNIFEVDLKSLCRSQETSSFGGPVWCMDANVDESLLAFGCEDGRVRLFEILPGEASGVSYARGFHSAANGRILSLKWHPNEKQSHVLFTGGIDGFIRKWDATKGNVLLQLSTESYGLKGESVCIWSLAVLQDSTLFAGDSEGYVSVWNTDSQLGSRLFSFHEHNADVTCLAVSKDETQVFASGIDSRVALFRKIVDETNEWVYSYSHRPHSYDVRGLVVVDNGQSIASGGNDTQICWLPIVEFAKSRPCKVSPFLHRPLVSYANDKMLVELQSHAEIWMPKTQKRLLEFRFRDRLDIRTSGMSRDGHVVAMSDDNGLKVFRVEGEATADRPLQLTPFTNLPRIDGGVPVAICFGSNTLACAMQQGVIHIFRLLENRVEKSETIDSLYKLRKTGTLGALRKVCISGDDQFLACGDSLGNIFIFSLDTHQLHVEISRAVFHGSLWTSFEFHPDQRTPLLVVSAMNNQCYFYQIESRTLQRSPVQITCTESNECIVGITFDPKDTESVVLWSRGYACRVHIQDGTLSFMTRYRPVAHMEFIRNNELLVVEAPWLKIMKKFENPLHRKRFGGAN